MPAPRVDRKNRFQGGSERPSQCDAGIANPEFGQQVRAIARPEVIRLRLRGIPRSLCEGRVDTTVRPVFSPAILSVILPRLALTAGTDTHTGADRVRRAHGKRPIILVLLDSMRSREY